MSDEVFGLDEINNKRTELDPNFFSEAEKETFKCDVNKLPEEIKTKAHEYVVKRKPRFRTFGIVSDDVEDAWLNGFAFCMEGTVTVKVKQCVNFEVYELLKKRARDLIYCVESCAKNELAVARCVERIKELL